MPIWANGEVLKQVTDTIGIPLHAISLWGSVKIWPPDIPVTVDMRHAICEYAILGLLTQNCIQIESAPGEPLRESIQYFDRII